METTSGGWRTGKRALRALCLCLAVGVVACGGGGDDTASPPSPSGTATVGAQGGTPAPDKAVAVSSIHAMTPHGTVFAQPVELRILIDTAAATGPGLLVALRTEPGSDGWDVLPIQKIENGLAVVNSARFRSTRWSRSRVSWFSPAPCSSSLSRSRCR